MMTTYDFDYDAFLDGLEGVDTLSNTNTSPTTISTENDSDRGISSTPPMPVALDSTIINLDDLDIFPIQTESPLSDDPSDEFNRFSALFHEKNPLVSDENSTFDNLFTDFDVSILQNQEVSQDISPSPLSMILPKSLEIPPINHCVKVQSYTNIASSGAQCIKIEPMNSNPNIRIIKASKPLPVANLPVIQMSLITNGIETKQTNSAAIASNKRRRSDSPTNYQQSNENSILTLDQLRLKYGNLSEEALKKHLRMIKNRESASLSRKRKKELLENLDVKVKELTDENEKLKRENSKLQNRIQTLEIENELLKKYKGVADPSIIQTKNRLIVMGIIFFVVFNLFSFKSLLPMGNHSSNSIALYDNERAIVPGRAILSSNDPINENSYLASTKDYYESEKNNDYNNNDPSLIPSYPYIQCVAYINKTHSQRINRDLRSLVQDHNENDSTSESTIHADSKSLSLKPKSIVPLQHIPRKVARQTKYQSEIKGQLQPYETQETNFDDFIHTIDRKNDTLYFVSFKRDHLILPATIQNQTQRPKMSLILPASIANLNKTIRVPTNHFPMIKIDCEVEDTKLVFIKHNHIPPSYQNHLFQYYSSAS